MIAVSVAPILVLLYGRSVGADVAPVNGCGGNHQPIGCTVESESRSDRFCTECSTSDDTCISRHLDAGYIDACSTTEEKVLCKATASATRRGFAIPLAGLLLAASIAASAKLRRRSRSAVARGDPSASA